eukprot:s6980_g4.t1
MSVPEREQKETAAAQPCLRSADVKLMQDFSNVPSSEAGSQAEIGPAFESATVCANICGVIGPGSLLDCDVVIACGQDTLLVVEVVVEVVGVVVELNVYTVSSLVTLLGVVEAVEKVKQVEVEVVVQVVEAVEKVKQVEVEVVVQVRWKEYVNLVQAHFGTFNKDEFEAQTKSVLGALLLEAFLGLFEKWLWGLFYRLLPVPVVVVAGLAAKVQVEAKRGRLSLKQPLLQMDFSFLGDKPGEEQITILDVVDVAQRNRDRTFPSRVWLFLRLFVTQLWSLRAALVDRLDAIQFDHRLLLDVARARRTMLLQSHDSAVLDASETFLLRDRGTALLDQRTLLVLEAFAAVPIPTATLVELANSGVDWATFPGIDWDCKAPIFGRGARLY